MKCQRWLALILICVLSVAGYADNHDGSGSTESELRWALQGVAALIHNRIAGVPPAAKTLALMIAHLQRGERDAAVRLATADQDFYNLRLRSMFSLWASVSGDVGADLNDMVATLIGMVRDDVPFNTALSADIIYVGALSNNNSCTPYSSTSNDHYRCWQDHNLKRVLQRRQQSALRVAPASIAGILSTRGFAESYYAAGTNRRATAFVFKNFLCREMETLHDVTVNDGYVRQDVNRTPGGDARLFRQRCVGCHAGLDALSGWNVRYDYRDGQMIYSNAVQNKIIRNVLFSRGNPPRDDSFVNLWTSGQNSNLGWQAPHSGNGARAWGQMITASRGFATCMASQVYEQICFRQADKATVASLADGFVANNYNMRELFVTTAVSCLAGEVAG